MPQNGIFIMFTYEDSLKYLNSFVNYEHTGLDRSGKAFNLEKVRRLLEIMGRPQDSYDSVHVTGTKGKGSTCAFISSILQASGGTVGLYTSPHLVSPRERIAVNGQVISKVDFAGILEKLRNFIIRSEELSGWTFFEVLTAAAMLYFKDRGVSHAVFEVGLGGRLDATNVIDPKVAVITPISFDHTNVLGGTIEEIASEKAAIVKRGSACVSAPQKPEAMIVIKERCSAVSASLSVVGEDIVCKGERMDGAGSVFDVTGMNGNYPSCETSLVGDFQPFNCALAIGVCEKLLGSGLTPEAVYGGVSRAFIPGRMEILGRAPLVMIDGAHNVASMERLTHSVKSIFKYGKLIVIAGFSQDKDIKGMCGILSSLADKIVLTRAEVGRAADPYILRGYFKGGDITAVTSGVKEALGVAFSIADKNDMILIAGSFFVIGEARKLLVGGEE